MVNEENQKLIYDCFSFFPSLLLSLFNGHTTSMKREYMTAAFCQCMNELSL